MKTRRTHILRCALFTLLAGATAAPFSNLDAQTAALSVSLSPSVTSPAAVGTVVTWTATVAGSASTNVSYRFRARGATPATCHSVRSTSASPTCTPPEFSLNRDFGPVSALDWTASEHEGEYEVEVSARDEGTGAVAVAAA